MIGFAIVVAAFSALVIGWAYFHRARWYGQNFEDAFQQRIRSELVAGQNADFNRASLTIREAGLGQRLVCETVRVHENGGEIGDYNYAVQFWPTLFGGEATDLASPRVAGAGNLVRNQPIC